MREVLSKYEGLDGLGFKEKEVLGYRNGTDEFILKDILQRENEEYWGNFLNRLSSNIKVTINIFNSKKKLRQKISSAPFSTAWELEFATFCISRNIKITTEEKTRGDSNVDFKIYLAGSEVLVEAHVRRLKDEEIKHVGAGDITRDLLRTVLEKQEQNNIPSISTIPFILALDGDYAGIDPINTRSFFNRNLEYASYLLEEHPEEIKSIDSDIFFLENNRFSFVSGIFLKHGSYYHFIVNALASNPLTSEQIKELMCE